MPEEIEGKSYLSSSEAADRAGVTQDTIYDWCRRGVIRCLKRRRGLRAHKWLVDEDSLEEYLKPEPV